MEALKDILQNILKELKNPQEKNLKLIEIWQKIAPEAKRHTKIYSFRGGVLRIYVDTPTLLYQLNLKRDYFLREFSSQIEDSVKNIEFRIGQI